MKRKRACCLAVISLDLNYLQKHLLPRNGGVYRASTRLYGARYWPAVKAYYDYEWGLIAEPPFSSAADEAVPQADEVFRPITSAGRRTGRKRA